MHAPSAGCLEQGWHSWALSAFDMHPVEGGEGSAGSGLAQSAKPAAEPFLLSTLRFAGSFGKVYKGKWRGIDVAVKVSSRSSSAAQTDCGISMPAFST